MTVVTVCQSAQRAPRDRLPAVSDISILPSLVFQDLVSLRGEDQAVWVGRTGGTNAAR